MRDFEGSPAVAPSARGAAPWNGRRLLMTLDAVGGVWRYAMDIAASLAGAGISVVFAGLGPKPSSSQRAEARAIGTLHWLNEPLDWMAGSATELDALPQTLARLVDKERIDLLHLNLPSQACALQVEVPIVVVSHSCVVTWFQAVRNQPCPAAWRWHMARNRGGFDRADVVLSPSLSHARAIEACYGPVERLRVAHNAAAPTAPGQPRQEFILAAGRWWDEGKNADVLDQAARSGNWPVRMAGPLGGPNGQRMVLQHAEALDELPSALVRKLMASAGIFVSPSFYEPFGLAALEAATCATPLVLADIPTYRELWDGAALFADPGNPEAFAAEFVRLIASEPLRVEMGKRALVRSRRFSPRRQLDAVVAAYNQARQNAGQHLRERCPA